MTPDRVVLVPSEYEVWAKLAAEFTARIAALLPGLPVEHIGSTSVPGLDAKPVVDLLVGAAPGTVGGVTEGLREAGFDVEGMRGRHSWMSYPGRWDRRVIVHVLERGSSGWERRLRFRDILRSSSVARERYLKVKRDSALRTLNWDEYTLSKSEVVDAILAEEKLELEVGTLTRAELLNQLAAADVGLNDYAETLLYLRDFDQVRAERMSVRFRCAAELGLTGGGTWAQLLAVAASRGFAPLPLRAGPYLRLALSDQLDAPDSVLSAGTPPSAAIHVASTMANASETDPRGFYLRTVDGRRWLRGFRCDDDYVLGPETVLALRLPMAATGTGA